MGAQKIGDQFTNLEHVPSSEIIDTSKSFLNELGEAPSDKAWGKRPNLDPYHTRAKSPITNMPILHPQAEWERKRQQNIADHARKEQARKSLEKSRAEAEQRELAKIFSQYPRCGPPKVNPAMAALDKRQADRVAKALADLDAKAEQRQAQSAEVNANSAETGSDSSPVHERNWRGLLHAVQQHVAQEEARQPGFSNTRVTDKGAQDVKDMIDQYISGSRRRLACL